MPNTNSSNPQTASQREPIAIIGVGCRLPGGVHDLDSFWQVVKNGVDTISDVPENRYSLETYFDPRPGTPGKMVSRQGGFLEQKLEEFDAAFFGISPREANILDPQQRLLLESTWEAFEDAGLTHDQVVGSHTGVFVGMWINEFEGRLFRDTSNLDLYSTTGSGRYAASGRISFIFDLHGPSLTLDTACSSSLVAFHYACQSVRSGESEMAIVGASNLILQPHIGVSYSRASMLAPDWRCKFGDADANGYVRSEGIGVIILKPLSKALADGNTVHALVLGSAANNDGQGSGLMVSPSKDGQAQMLRMAYRDAQISPGKVGYIEAHGTGTPAGDPIELSSLSEVLAEGREPGKRCAVGSAKTNFGHTEGTAGLTGIMKTILCLKHRMIPANLNFKTPTPKVNWDEIPIYLPTELKPWVSEGEPLIAGVNAFGITGTNAHIVLGEAPPVDPIPRVEPVSPLMLPLSARSPEALQAMAGQMADYLNGSPSDLSAILYTASQRRWHHEHRLAVSADTSAALAETLKAFSAQDPTAQLTVGQAEAARKIVFVFPGQGSQWIGMGRQLYESEPAFRQAIQRCDEAFKPFVDWSLLEQIHAGEGESALTEIDVIQPTLFALEIALAETWRAWGVEPDAVVGHSMGEPAAAYIAGALSLEDAARVICTRSRLMKRVSGKGGMVVVDLTPEQANAALVGYEDRLSVAVSNGPRATVISGDKSAIDEVTAQLEAIGTFVRPVKVDVAAHSPHMDPLRPELVDALAQLNPLQPSVPIYSTVTASLVDFPLDSEYWGRNLRQPVMFARTVDLLTSDGYTLFIECSPHPILLGAIEQNKSSDSSALSLITLPSMRRGEDEVRTLLRGRETVYCQGGSIDWQRLYPQAETLKFPSYPWQRERFWDQEADMAGTLAGLRPSERLISTLIENPDQPGAKTWQAQISLETHPYLKDHRVNETVLLPAAAFVEMLFETASTLAEPLLVESLALREALVLQPETSYVLQLIVEADNSFRILSHVADDTQWTEHAQGILRRAPGSTPAAASAEFDTLQADGTEHPGSEHISAMRSRGLNYGPAFQAVTAFRSSQALILGQIQIPPAVPGGEYSLHPILLDAAFQLVITSLDDSQAAGDAFLPVSMASCIFFARPRSSALLSAYVTRTSADHSDLLVGNIRLEDEQGQVVLDIQGLEMRRFIRKTQNLDDLVFGMTWRETPNLPQPASSLAGSFLIVSSDREAAEALSVHLQNLGTACRIVQEPDTLSLQAAFAAEEKAPRVIFLASSTVDNLAATARLQSLQLLELVQTLGQKEWKEAPRLWVVTRGAQAVLPGEDTAPDQAALWGLAATILHEFPGWQCTRVDLDPNTTWTELSREIAGGQSDPIALRGEKRYSAHLVNQPLRQAGQPEDEQTRPADGSAFQVEVAQPGILDSIALRECIPPQAEAGKVLIEVKSAGLNFVDVMRALGILPGVDPNDPVGLGLECAGTIVALGAPLNGDAQNLSVGKEVMAFAPYSFQKYVNADAHLVKAKPAGLSFEEAAGIPVVYLTVYYALCHLGHLRRGERILIHSAAGGVGLAAIQIAKYLGAEIFATAGSEEKRAYLRSLGIQQVMDSHSLDFARQVMSATDGKGVDVVLNSLTGEAITRSLSLLAPYGRFLEIGKRDIYQNTRIGLLPFQKNLSYFAIDLDRMGRERPELLGELFGEVVELLEANKISALPTRTYPVTETHDAIRHISEPDHIGKIVLSLNDPQLEILPLHQPFTIKPHGTYLITGGLGALGLSVADWLVEHGACNLALVGRSREDRLAAPIQESLAALRARGTNLIVLSADISRADQAAGVIQTVQEKCPPLTGVIHAAGLLEDGILSQQTAERFDHVFAPKVNGSWNLHQLTREIPLDFFVMFSSVASAFGSPGQGNYAAANAFMDGLAYHRQAQGLKALSINWGPWGQIGLAAQQNRGGLQGLGGLSLLEPAVGMELFGQLLTVDDPQVIVTGLNAAEWQKSHPGMARSSLMLDLDVQSDTQESASGNPIRNSLLAAQPGRPRQTILESLVQEQAAQVLRLPAARVELHKPLRTVGMDSLMAIEFRNRLESSLEITLSASLVWNYPTINEMVPHLAEKMGIPLEVESQPEVLEPEGQELTNQVSKELDGLSDAEVAAMLDDELRSVADIL